MERNLKEIGPMVNRMGEELLNTLMKELRRVNGDLGKKFDRSYENIT